MRRLITAAAFAITSLALQPAAQAAEDAFPNITDPKQVVESLDVDVLAEIVTQIGGGDVRKHTDQKQKGVSFLDGQTPHNLVLTFCDIEPGKCFGVLMLVVVDNSKLNFTLDTLNQGNKDSAFLTFYREENSKFLVGRVDIVEGGITQAEPVQLGDEIAEQHQLPRGARVGGGVLARLRVVADVAEEALEDRTRHPAHDASADRHSVRRARIGASPAARVAGTTLATSAANPSAPAATPSATGSQ